MSGPAATAADDRASLPKRIVVVDDDPGICRLLGTALGPPEFDLRAFDDPRSALAALPALRPDLIICDITMPGMDGHAFLEEVKRSGQRDDVAFVFLSAVQDEEEIVASFSRGADDFVSKPFHLLRFVAKVRATLRLAERRTPDVLTGAVDEGGTLPLLRYCEERRLTGRLTVRADGVERWADFLGGDMTAAGGIPEPTGEDAFDALLGMTAGSYRVEQRPLDAAVMRATFERLRAGDAATMSPAAEGTPAVPSGRLSRIDVRGQAVEIQTEGGNQPDFRIVTVVARGGQILRKIESGWAHALLRREDEALARAQIDRQHERVLATLRDVAHEVPVSADAAVDPSLLAWAVSFVADQVRVLLGGVMVAALLRRTHREAGTRWPALKAFRVSEEGRAIVTEPAPGPAGAGLPAAAAGWTSSFLRAAGEIAEKARGVSVRRVTRMLESELDRCGFYAALD
jgi:CheY-like chemotaxis protein